MRTLELFCGTKSFSKIAKERGFDAFTLDNDAQHKPDLCADILSIEGSDIPDASMIWASPPCEGFSVAVIGRNWNHDYTPKHSRAELAMKLAQKTLALILEKKPRWYFIENPVGMLRKMPFMLDFLSQTGGCGTK